MLTFDEEEHRYYLDGTELPSVTTILTEAGLKGAAWYKPEYALIGKRRHKAVELYNLGTLDWSTVHEDDLKYMEGFILALKELDIVVEKAEQMMYHELYRYAGTVDMLGTVREAPFVIDLKGVTHERWHELQLILYGNMALFDGEKPGIMSLHPNPKTGKYKHFIYTYDDERAALGALAVAQWKRR